jgi:hypothetical protein
MRSVDSFVESSIPRYKTSEAPYIHSNSFVKVAM